MDLLRCSEVDQPHVQQLIVLQRVLVADLVHLLMHVLIVKIKENVLEHQHRENLLY